MVRSNLCSNAYRYAVANRTARTGEHAADFPGLPCHVDLFRGLRATGSHIPWPARRSRWNTGHVYASYDHHLALALGRIRPIRIQIARRPGQIDSTVAVILHIGRDRGADNGGR